MHPLLRGERAMMTTMPMLPMMADVDDDQDDMVRSARAKLELVVVVVQLVTARMVGCDGGFDSRSWCIGIELSFDFGFWLAVDSGLSWCSGMVELALGLDARQTKDSPVPLDSTWRSPQTDERSSPPLGRAG